MVIRSANLDDLDAVAAVEAECFPAAEEFRDRIKVYGDHFLLLFIGDKLVSFVDGMVTDRSDIEDIMYEDASLHDPDGRWQMIFGVNTIPEYRR